MIEILRTLLDKKQVVTDIGTFKVHCGKIKFYLNEKLKLIHSLNLKAVEKHFDKPKK